MSQFEEATAPDYRVEYGVDGTDHIVAVKPPVDTAFKEVAFDVVSKLGFLKEVVVRDGFFKTVTLPDGTPYSELRVPGDALSVNGQTIPRVARQCTEVLRSQNYTADLNPYMVAVGGSRQFFDDRKRS